MFYTKTEIYNSCYESIFLNSCIWLVLLLLLLLLLAYDLKHSVYACYLVHLENP